LHSFSAVAALNCWAYLGNCNGGEVVEIGRELLAERCKDDADAAGDGAVRLSIGRLASVGEAAASMVRL
jgi:hypothetical protein